MPAVMSSSATFAQPLGEPLTQLRPPMVQQPKLISETFTSDDPRARYCIAYPWLMMNGICFGCAGRESSGGGKFSPLIVRKLRCVESHPNPLPEAGGCSGSRSAAIMPNVPVKPVQPRTRLRICIAAGVIVLGLAVRLPHLNQSLWYDEMTTLTEYVLQPWSKVLAAQAGEYVPNNHVLHTILAKLTYLFGSRLYYSDHSINEEFFFGIRH